MSRSSGMSRWFHCAVMAIAALACLAAPSAVAKDTPAYAKGLSQQMFDERPFDLHIPDDYDPEKTWGLIVQIDGMEMDTEPFVSEGYIVCRPKKKYTRNAATSTWAGSAVEDVRSLAIHLAKKLNVPENRIHLIGFDQGIHGILTMVAFGKKSPFISVTYMMSSFHTGSIAKRAKTKMGMLWQGNAEKAAESVKLPTEMLDGKVRSIEERDEPRLLETKYYRYWLKVMEGEFTPGHDQSFWWQTDERELPESGTRADLPPLDLMAQGRALAERRRQPLMLYVYSDDDADNPAAKTLQNVTFMSHHVRKPAELVVAVKVEQKELAAVVGEEITVAETPAVVLFDHTGKEAARFEGKVPLKKLSKTLSKLAAKAEKANR